MSDVLNSKCLETLIKEGNVEAVMQDFNRLQESVGKAQTRFREWAIEQTDALNQQIAEKEAIISALLKCITLLNNEGK